MLHQRALADAVAAEHADDLAAGRRSTLDALQHVAGGIARAQVVGGEDRAPGSGPPEIDVAHVLRAR